jgi:uncharacterized protein YkwD
VTHPAVVQPRRAARTLIAGAVVAAIVALLAGVPPAAVPAAVATTAASVGTTTASSATIHATTATTTTTATTAASMAASVLTWVNQARIARGLRPLRGWNTLSSLATYRAGRMASTGSLSHSVGGDLGSELTARVTWWTYGEAIGMTTAGWGTSAAWSLYTMWKASSFHWSILMSSRLNYVGLGFAYRSANGATYASVIETESPDHSPPTRSFTGSWRSGTTIGWSWTGSDVALQTHTSGLRNFDVNERRDDGSWVRLRSGTTSRSLSLSGRAHGHTYLLSIRARDYRGNVSSWTTRSIYVP